MMLFAVVIGLIGAFAFKTPKHNSKSTVTRIGLPIGNYTITNNTITITNPVDVTGQTAGSGYSCTTTSGDVCTIHPTITISTPLPSSLTLTNGQWTKVDNNADFSQP